MQLRSSRPRGQPLRRRAHARSRAARRRHRARTPVPGRAAPASPVRRGRSPTRRASRSPFSACSVPGEQREERGFTAAIAAGEAIFQPGPSCREALSTRFSQSREGEVAQDDHGRGGGKAREARKIILPAGQPEPSDRHVLQTQICCLMFALVAPFAVAQVDSRPLTDAERTARERARVLKDEADKGAESGRCRTEGENDACYKKFQVSSCLEDAKRKHTTATREAKRKAQEGGEISATSSGAMSRRGTPGRRRSASPRQTEEQGKPTRPTRLRRRTSGPRKSPRRTEGCGGSAKTCRGTGETAEKLEACRHRRKPRLPRSERRAKRSRRRRMLRRPTAGSSGQPAANPGSGFLPPVQTDSRACRRKRRGCVRDRRHGRRSARSSRRCRASFFRSPGSRGRAVRFAATAMR